jgi:ribosomal protein L1
MDKAKVLEAVKNLRKDKERKFSQTVDLIINLKSFDMKKDSVNLFLSLPHKFKEPKIGAFLTKKSGIVETITKDDFGKYKDKKELKKLVKKHDFFISAAALMPAVATTFGRFLGPEGKMPSPQLGIIREENDAEIKKVLDNFSKIIRVKSKEPSLKFSVGKDSMKDEDIVDNVYTAYNTVVKNLPRQKDNVKSIMIKLTMGRPIKLEI